MRPDDEKLAALAADIDLAVGKYGGSLLHRPEVLLPQLLAGLDIEGVQISAVIGLVQPVAIDYGRGESPHETFDHPFDAVRAELAFAGGIKGHQRAHFNAFDIFVPVGNDGVLAV